MSTGMSHFSDLFVSKFVTKPNLPNLFVVIHQTSFLHYIFLDNFFWIFIKKKCVNLHFISNLCSCFMPFILYKNNPWYISKLSPTVLSIKFNKVSYLLCILVLSIKRRRRKLVSEKFYFNKWSINYPSMFLHSLCVCVYLAWSSFTQQPFVHVSFMLVLVLNSMDFLPPTCASCACLCPLVWGQVHGPITFIYFLAYHNLSFG